MSAIQRFPGVNRFFQCASTLNPSLFLKPDYRIFRNCVYCGVNRFTSAEWPNKIKPGIDPNFCSLCSKITQGYLKMYEKGHPIHDAWRYKLLNPIQ